MSPKCYLSSVYQVHSIWLVQVWSPIKRTIWVDKPYTYARAHVLQPNAYPSVLGECMGIVTSSGQNTSDYCPLGISLSLQVIFQLMAWRKVSSVLPSSPFLQNRSLSDTWATIAVLSLGLIIPTSFLMSEVLCHGRHLATLLVPLTAPKYLSCSPTQESPNNIASSSSEEKSVHRLVVSMSSGSIRFRTDLATFSSATRQNPSQPPSLTTVTFVI